MNNEQKLREALQKALNTLNEIPNKKLKYSDFKDSYAVCSYIEKILAETKEAGNTYYFAMRENNGEQEYTHAYLITASSLEEAQDIARNHAKEFYCDGEEVEGEKDTYEFDGGALRVKIMCVEPMSKAHFDEQELGYHYL